MASDDGPITMLLRQWGAGDQVALEKVTPLIYAELRNIAARYLRGERAGHTFRPSDLIAEAFARLLGQEQQPDWSSRGHFFAIAARAMRQILVDHARRRAAKKRDGRECGAPEAALEPRGRPEELLDLDRALDRLAQLDERKARVLELHYFAGLTQTELANALDVHVNTVARELRLAEAWVERELVSGA